MHRPEMLHAGPNRPSRTLGIGTVVSDKQSERVASSFFHIAGSA